MSEVYFAYHALVDMNALVAQAAHKGLAEAAIYLGSEYQKVVPSRRVARSVNIQVKPPRAYVGPKDFRSRFFEKGAAPHLIQARGVTKRYSRRARKDGTRRVLGYYRGRRYLAIPTGSGTIFRTTAMHPGMRAGGYFQRTAESGLPVVQELLGRAFREVFR